MKISEHALKAAKSIADFCAGRFPTDVPPHPRFDIPWFAEKIQIAIDAALAERETSQTATLENQN